MFPITLSLHNYFDKNILFGLLMYLKDFFFDYTFLSSWFFGACIVAMPIVFLLRKQPVVLFLLCIVLYLYF